MKTSYSVKLGAALIPVSFFAAYMASCFYYNPPITSADCAAWLGAIGTVGAIIGAISIASSQERHRRLDGMAAARICACGLIFRLAHARAEVKFSLDWFTTNAVGETEPEVFSKFADILSSTPRPGENELLRLAPLPKNCAFLLAAAYDRLFVSINVIRSATRAADFNQNAERRATLSNLVSLSLSEAHRFIDIAVNEMQHQSILATRTSLPDAPAA